MRVLLIFTLFFSFLTIAHEVSYKQWLQMNFSERQNYLDNQIESLSYKYIGHSYKLNRSFINRFRFKSLNPNVKIVLHKLINKRIDDYDSIETIFNGISLVGKMDREVLLYYSSDNKFIGAVLHITQRGCSHLDQDGELIENYEYLQSINAQYHYSTKSDALKRGCVDNDVSWSAHSKYDHKFETLEEDYLEWSGH